MQFYFPPTLSFLCLALSTSLSNAHVYKTSGSMHLYRKKFKSVPVNGKKCAPLTLQHNLLDNLITR